MQKFPSLSLKSEDLKGYPNQRKHHSNLNEKKSAQDLHQFTIPNKRMSSRMSLYSKGQKTINPFEVQDEDRIFSELQPKKIKKKKKKVKINYITNNDKILRKIYKSPPKFEMKLSRIKRQKSTLPLDEYQNILLTTLSGHISRESTIKLGKTFTNLRLSCNKRYETNYNYVKEIEDKEEKIYNRINYREEMFYRIIEKNKTEDKRKKVFVNLNSIKLLPKIKFEKVIKSS